MKLYTFDNVFIKETNSLSNIFTGIVEHDNGTKVWYVNNTRHRIDGAAVEYFNGEKSWWVNGKRHRIDDPACEYKYEKYWYIDNKEVTELQHKLLHDVMRLKGML